MRANKSGASGYNNILHKIISFFKLWMHRQRDSVQYGIVIPNVCLIFVLSRTEYAGRTTGEGNSSL